MHAVDLNRPQVDLLADHFTQRPSISADEARSLYRVRSLSRRIVDMMRSGHRFSKVKQEDPTGRKYVRYFWLGKH